MPRTSSSTLLADRKCRPQIEGLERLEAVVVAGSVLALVARLGHVRLLLL